MQGLPVNSLYLLLLILTAVSIVLLIQVVGIVLVMAMLTIPAAMANLFTSPLIPHDVDCNRLECGFLFHWDCNFVPPRSDWPAGATIALCAGIAYILSMAMFRKSAA